MRKSYTYMGICQVDEVVAYVREFLGRRAVPGIEHTAPGLYRRTLRLLRGTGVLELGAVPGAGDPPAGHLVADDPPDRAEPVGEGDAPDRAPARVLVDRSLDRPEAEVTLRRLLGSDERAAAADAQLRGDPVLGPLVEQRPGLRVPGTVDGGELAMRAVLGQQVSLAAARTLAGRLVAAAGDRLAAPDGELTHVWPVPEAVAEAAATLAMPRSRQNALATLARALAAGELRLEPGADLVATRAQLRALPGIGTWTADYVAMRALDDPDAWLPTDLGVRHALNRLGASPAAAEAWRPFRAYAVAHLWASLADG
jgi:AraC family transcriptional regulator, regulatory protein of adaptative response / DNA-3-methyladenine glycosylase II